MTIAFIGFGEAGMAFADELASPASAYDRKTDDAGSKIAGQKWADFERLGVKGKSSSRDAVSGASIIFSLVTADQAVSAARACAADIGHDALFCDFNSVAPQTKCEARDAIENGGGRYVDVAVMAPVYPKKRLTPLLISGPHSEAASAALAALGFAPRSMAGLVGAASAVKMIRSVMMKGIEALTAECFMAAEAAGVRDQVCASLDASPPPPGWEARAAYNLERIIVHGVRRAAEMDEVVKTLETLGVGSAMSQATAKRQRAIGELGLKAPPDLSGLLSSILAARGPAS